MPKINIYLPEEMAEEVRAAAVSVSSVCQRALEQEVRKVKAMNEATSDLEKVATRLRDTREDESRREYEEGFEVGVDWAKNLASEAELRGVAETAEMGRWISIGLDDGHSLAEFLSQTYGGGGDLQRDPWSEGIVDGAKEVYEKVLPLL